MALPALDKTWNFASVNLAQGATYDRHDGYRKMIRLIKDTLVSWGWVVKGSCGYYHGTTWTYDYSGTDYWDVDSAVQWGGDTYGQYWSWFVLKYPNAGGPGNDLEFCFLCDGGVWDGCHLGVAAISFQGFSGGTWRVMPSAADLQWVEKNWSYGGRSATVWMSYWNGGDMYSGAERFDTAMHFMRSTDGECQRIIVVKDNTVLLYIAFEKLKNPVSGWTHPCTFVYNAYNGGGGITNGNPTYAWLNDRAQYNVYHNGRWGYAYLAAEGYGGATLGENVTYRNEITGEHQMCPATIISDAYGMRGRYGRLYDQWWGSTEMANGDTFPNDETAQFISFGDMIFPWNGSAPRML